MWKSSGINIYGQSPVRSVAVAALKTDTFIAVTDNELEKKGKAKPFVKQLVSPRLVTHLWYRQNSYRDHWWDTPRRGS